MKMKKVFLTRQWSGHEAGETVTVEDFTAESMVRKNYGRIVTDRTSTSATPPVVETATATPVAETTVATPQKGGKTGGKGGD